MIALALALDLPVTPHPVGLGGLLCLVQGVERALPLTGVRVRSQITAGFVTTEIVQRYENPHAVAMEAVHIFPLPAEGAVTAVELRAGELIARATCKERQEAQKTYDTARAQGQLTSLLTAERADVHTLRVANLPPGQSVRVAITVIERLTPVDGLYTWRLPTTLAPRYNPGQAAGHSGPGVLPDTDQVPDASRLQPPLRLTGGTLLDLEVEVTGPVRKLSAAQHCVGLELDGDRIRVAPRADTTMDRDFVLRFALGETEDCAAWTDGTHTAVLVSAPPDLSGPACPRDAVFVVDISGSMEGQKMTAAKTALHTALHGLVAGDRFRLIAFDDRIEEFAPQASEYNDATLKAADRWIDRLQPRGGTEMLPAIQRALEGDTPAGRLRTVLFVTDGQATNEDELAAAVTHRRKGALFFTLGIDTAVNEALMKRLARVGGGVATLCTPLEDIEAAVAALEARFGSPVATAVVVEGEVARRQALPLFRGAPIAVLLEGAPATVRATLTTASGPRTLEAKPRPVSQRLGALWARERVAALEDAIVQKPSQEEAYRGEILSVALEHQIASRFTAFVVVEERITTSGPSITVVQPAELPAGWSEDFLGGAPSPRGGAPMAEPTAAVAFFSMPKRAQRAAAPPPPVAFSAALPIQAPREEAEAAAPSMDFMEAEPTAPAPEAKKSRSVVSRLRDTLFGAPPPAPPPPAMSPAPAPGMAPPQPMKMAKEEASALSAAPTPPIDGRLARAQRADGSFGDTLLDTAAALVLLVLAGHSRSSGLRRRTVAKAADWLAGHRGQSPVEAAFALLEALERGETLTPHPGLAALRTAPTWGADLTAALTARGWT